MPEAGKTKAARQTDRTLKKRCPVQEEFDEVGKYKRLLVAMLVVGAITAIAGGTFASFNATTSNNAALTTGVLVMSNTVAGGTGACYSTGVSGSITAANSSACADTLTLGGLTAPGNTNATARLTISNIGNLPASLLQMQAGGACSVASSGYTFNAINFTGNAPLSGAGSLCGITEVAVFQTDAAFDGATNTGGTCIYGNAAANDIAGSVSGTTCGFGPTYTLDDLGANYKFGDSGAGGATGTRGPLGVGGLTAASGATPSAFFLIGFKVLGTANNSFQGQRATENVTWFMVQ